MKKASLRTIVKFWTLLAKECDFHFKIAVIFVRAIFFLITHRKTVIRCSILVLGTMLFVHSSPRPSAGLKTLERDSDIHLGWLDLLVFIPCD